MGLYDDVTQWLGENVVQPVKRANRASSNWLADFDPEGSRQALALMHPDNARKYIEEMPEETRGKVLNGAASYDEFMGQGSEGPGPTMAGTTNPLDFANKGMGPRGAAAEAAAMETAANTVLPGKAGLVRKAWNVGKKLLPVAAGYGMAKMGSGKPADATLPPLPANGGQLEYTPEQAEEAWRNKVASEKAKTADTSAPKEEPFDINAIADKYGAEVSPSGGLLSDKKVSKQDEKGLVYKGLIKNEATGKTTYMYGAKPQAQDTAEAGTKPDFSSREGAYKHAIELVKQNIGVDPTTFNPVTETKKILDADQEYQYMKKRLLEGNFTQQKRAQIQALIQEKEQQVSKELIYKAGLANSAIKSAMDIYDKNKDKFGVAPAGGTIYSKETGQAVNTIPGKEGTLPANQTTAIEKAVDRAFLGDVPEAARQMGGKVYDNLPDQSRSKYDQVTETAGRMMLDSAKAGKAITPQEAVRQAVEKIQGQTGGGGKVTPGTKLDKNSATTILKEAGGDKTKARQIAAQRGFSL